jgi:hypothetical protein
MDEHGNSRDDLTLPKGTSDAESLAKQLQDDFDAGKELVVTVLKVTTARSRETWQCLSRQRREDLSMRIDVTIRSRCVEAHAPEPCS